MSELRWDRTTNEWVIIAPERGWRPIEQLASNARAPEKDRLKDCPFCPGNENRTPPEIARIPDNGRGLPGWRVRVVPNQYPVMKHRAANGERVPQITTDRRLGVGFHEVIVDTPEHDQSFSEMSHKQLGLLVNIYRQRLGTLRAAPGVEHTIVFKNHGQPGGASMRHPHSQLIALPQIPAAVAKRYRVGRAYFNAHGSCQYCNMIEDECAADRRVVFLTDDVVVWQPFAQRSPFETWIAPRHHQSHFFDAPQRTCIAAAIAVQVTLRLLSRIIGPASFNYVIQSPPSAWSGPWCHWFIRVVPRTATPGGFEHGTGMYINTNSPEQSASIMRKEAKMLMV